MTREQEREQASVEYTKSTNPRAIGGDAFSDVTYIININHSFIKGARWADRTMLDNVCECLKKLVYQEYPGGPLVRRIDDEELKDLRKAMEE